MSAMADITPAIRHSAEVILDSPSVGHKILSMPTFLFIARSTESGVHYLLTESCD